MPRPKLKRLLKRQTNFRWEDLGIGDILGLSHGHWHRWRDGADDFSHKLKSMEDVEEFCAANGESLFEVEDQLKSRQPGNRAWCWWKFFSDEERDQSLPEVEQLDRLGLLTDAELAAIRADIHTKGINNQYHEMPFRRSWGWWRFAAPKRYDWSGVPELIHLERMPDALTDREKFILENHEDIPECRKHGKTGKDSLRYIGLSDDERVYLGVSNE